MTRIAPRAGQPAPRGTAQPAPSPGTVVRSPTAAQLSGTTVRSPETAAWPPGRAAAEPGPGRTGLGDFLRSRRERLTPQDVGLPAGRRRRTPGLRREEVAELAGIGVDWYVRLEQGRAVRPSAETVSTLARALRLDETERRHLRLLALAPQHPAFEPENVPEGTRCLVESLNQPAYVTGRRWDLLAWNAAAAELFGGFESTGRRAGAGHGTAGHGTAGHGTAGHGTAGRPNILTYVLLDPAAREVFGPGWEDQARHVVAQFRAAHDLWAPDPAFAELAGRLRDGCPEFGTWWEEHEVVGTGAGRKLLNHPANGPVAYDYATFQANEDPALRLTLYAPVPSWLQVQDGTQQGKEQLGELTEADAEG